MQNTYLVEEVNNPSKILLADSKEDAVKRYVHSTLGNFNCPLRVKVSQLVKVATFVIKPLFDYSLTEEANG